MATLPDELKRKIADLYLENRKKLEGLDSGALESFASELLEMINGEKEALQPSHDLTVLETSMRHLKRDAALLMKSKPDTEDYEFALNDCRKLVDSTRKWLKLEKLISSQ